MTQLDDKINQHFAGLVVRKDLVKAVKGNAIVPTYVLEYLLGQSVRPMTRPPSRPALIRSGRSCASTMCTATKQAWCARRSRKRAGTR